MQNNPSHAATDPDPARDARSLVRSALKGSLATLARDGGGPYASLVTVATEPDGTPIVLISRLAVHTQNILADPRVSLMIDGTNPFGDPLAGGRISLQGRMVPATSDTHRRRFLARHPGAAMYAGFADFQFYVLAVERAHFIGGFGRILDLERDEVLLDADSAAALAIHEPDIVSHMNEDHADAVALYAAESGDDGAAASRWQMTGVDPEGFDLASDGQAKRIPFSKLALTPNDVRVELVRLAKSLKGAPGR